MALPAQVAETERLFTATEFENLAEFEENYELIEGRLVKKPVPNSQHTLIADFIKEQYFFFDPYRKVGRMLIEASTNIGPNDTPQPDLSFWLASRVPQPSLKAAPTPDLVVEVLSPRDLETRKRREEALNKVRRYQVAGVSFIWLINPKAKQVEVYQPGRLEPVQVLGVEDELDAGDLIPGFKFSLKELFR